MSKVQEMRDLGVDALRAKEQDLYDQVFRLRIQKAMGQLDAPHKVRATRRELSRVKTILREKAE
jgi:large subunit ribosomal protein L29